MHWHIIKPKSMEHLAIAMSDDSRRDLTQSGVSEAHLCFLELEKCNDAMEFITAVMEETTRETLPQ